MLEPDAVVSEDVLPSSNRQKLSIGDAPIISEEHKHVKKVQHSGSCASMSCHGDLLSIVAWLLWLFREPAL